MASFYENKEYEMVSSVEKNIYWAWSHKEDQIKVFRTWQKTFYPRGKTTTIAKHQIIKDG